MERRSVALLSLAPMGLRLPAGASSLRSRAVELQRSLNGALAGMVAAGVWAAQQPLDKKVFESDYDDVALLGKLVVRDSSWPAAGAAMHLANGAIFGIVYAQLRPFVPGPPVAAGVAAGLAEHFALWPLGRAGGPLPPRPRRARHAHRQPPGAGDGRPGATCCSG